MNIDRKSTRLNSSHLVISYAVFCLKKNKQDELGATEHCRGAPVSYRHFSATAVRPLSQVVLVVLLARCTTLFRHLLFFFFNGWGPPRILPPSPPQRSPD